MACEERMQSPESGVSSLLASSGRLHSFLHPQPEHIITYRDKHYSSASAALDAYISDYQQSLGSRTLQLHTHTRTRKDTDVLKSSLTDRELSVLNIPTRRDSDRLSLTTDDLLDLPNDGSLPVTRTSALLTRSESFPVEHSFNSRPCSHLRPTFLKCSLCPPAELAKTLHGAHLRSQSKAPPPNILPANQRLPLDTPTYRNLPRWMSSHRVPPWVTELEEGRSQTEVKDHSGEDVSLRELRLQHTHSNTLQTANTPPLFKVNLQCRWASLKSRQQLRICRGVSLQHPALPDTAAGIIRVQWRRSNTCCTACRPWNRRSANHSTALQIQQTLQSRKQKLWMQEAASLY
uniref:lung adenoma susceptibility protein 2 isoform 14 n=1 Tax=Danio rerio TaxID=7955 RepID=UPI003F5D4E0B